MVPVQIPDLGFIEAVRSGAEVTAILPDDMPALELLTNIRICGSQIANLDRTSAVLKYALGRMMVMADRNPLFLEAGGFKNFKEFEEDLKGRTKLGRSTLWSWKPIYEALPDLTREQLDTIPARSLYLIAQHVPESKQQALLETAPQVTYEELKTHAEEQGFISPGQIGGASLIVSGSREQILELKSFLMNPSVLEYCGTTEAIEVLLSAIAETQSSVTGWPKI